MSILIDMETSLEPHRQRIQKIGKLLSVFVIIWLVINSTAMLLVVASLLVFKVAGSGEGRSNIIELFTNGDLVPGVDATALQKILEWDYDNFLQTFWLTLFLAVFSAIYFIITMILILRIARSMKAGNVLSETSIKSMQILGWLYLMQGIVGQLWGMLSHIFTSTSTYELIYFSFIRDTCLYSFSFSGTGIEWGMLVLAISYILKHARLLREEQMLVV